MASSAPSESRFEVAHGDIVAEDFDGEYVILDVSCGHYYSLRGCAALLWDALIQGYSPAALCAAAADFPAWWQAEVVAFVERLTGLGLLRESAEPAVGDVAGDRAAVLARHTSVPEVDAFDDLADLIAADPIHDVEADTGWPNRRTAG